MLAEHLRIAIHRNQRNLNEIVTRPPTTRFSFHERAVARDLQEGQRNSRSSLNSSERRASRNGPKRLEANGSFRPCINPPHLRETGPKSCTFTYLRQQGVALHGSIQNRLESRASRFFFPKSTRGNSFACTFPRKPDINFAIDRAESWCIAFARGVKPRSHSR